MNMNKEIAISVRELSKMYKIYMHPLDLAKEIFFHKKSYREFRALEDISFEVERGEVVGVIGRNGAGKSTLLKIVAGTLDKTSGNIDVNGKVSAILELGSGFHPEYTGRDNVYMGGMVLGMNKREIDRKYKDIVGFSELEEYMDLPFKVYSAGMQARLTFSVAISVEPDVFLIDEALAAGDAFFVDKCLHRIIEICKSGKTVFFASHNIFLVQRLCSRAIWLDKGRIREIGSAMEVCRNYETSVRAEESQRFKQEKIEAADKKWGAEDKKPKWGSGEVKITDVQLLDANCKETYSFLSGDKMTVRVHYETERKFSNPGFYVLITRNDGVMMTTAFSSEPEVDLGVVKGKGYVDIIFEPLLLGQGEFFLSTGIFPYKTGKDAVMRLDPFDFHDKLYKFSVKRKKRPLMTAFEQPVKWQHTLEEE